MRSHRLLGFGLFMLGAVIAATAVLGPFVAGVIRYHTSATTLNQVVGGDAAALFLVAPACLAVGMLALREHPSAPALALAPALFAVYTYTQLIVGEEYLRLPGNNEQYFPLMYAGFLLGGAITVISWRRLDPVTLPAPSRRLRLAAAVALFGVTLFLAGQHLATFADALRETPTRVEYVSSPTAFWLVKLMDLGIVVPVAVVAAVGLLRDAPWAPTPMYAIIGAYTLVGVAVTAMAITMLVNADPDASPVLAAGFAVLTLAFAALALAVYRPLFHIRECTRPAPTRRRSVLRRPGTSATRTP
jgi:hypothetical protein